MYACKTGWRLVAVATVLFISPPMAAQTVSPTPVQFSEKLADIRARLRDLSPEPPGAVTFVRNGRRLSNRPYSDAEIRCQERQEFERQQLRAQLLTGPAALPEPQNCE
jgi:hypothetical protein